MAASRVLLLPPSSAPGAPLLGETPEAFAARQALALRPEWPALRQDLWESLRLLDPAAWGRASRRAQVSGLWESARVDLSWAADAFLDGQIFARRLDASSMMTRKRALAFENAGFAWSTLAPRVAAEACERILGAMQLAGPAWLAPAPGPAIDAPDGGKLDGASSWLGVALRFFAFPETLGRHENEEPLPSERSAAPIDPAIVARLNAIYALRHKLAASAEANSKQGRTPKQARAAAFHLDSLELGFRLDTPLTDENKRSWCESLLRARLEAFELAKAARGKGSKKPSKKAGSKEAGEPAAATPAKRL